MARFEIWPPQGFIIWWDGNDVTTLPHQKRWTEFFFLPRTGITPLFLAVYLSTARLSHGKHYNEKPLAPGTGLGTVSGITSPSLPICVRRVSAMSTPCSPSWYGTQKINLTTFFSTHCPPISSRQPSQLISFSVTHPFTISILSLHYPISYPITTITLRPKHHKLSTRMLPRLHPLSFFFYSGQTLMGAYPLWFHIYLTLLAPNSELVALSTDITQWCLRRDIYPYPRADDIRALWRIRRIWDFLWWFQNSIHWPSLCSWLFLPVPIDQSSTSGKFLNK